MHGPSDEDLMLRVARGDEAAFRLLAQRYAARAVRLARRTTGSEADAEEIVQEALLRVWINAPRWRPVAAFRTWFYRVVLNLSLNRRRRASFVPLEQAGDPPDPAADPSTQLERDELDRRVASAVAELPAQQRAAITLTYAEGTQQRGNRRGHRHLGFRCGDLAGPGKTQSASEARPRSGPRRLAAN